MAMAKAASKMLPCGLLASRRLSVETMLVDSMAVAETATLPEFKPLYRRLSGLGATPGGSVAEILKEWQSEGKIVTESQLLNFVRQLRRYKSYKTALELMDWMDANGIKLSSCSHAVRLDIVAKFKGIDEAEKYFANLPEISKNQQTYGALLSGYCQGKMSDKAIALFNKMKEQNISCNTLTYNNLMSLHMKLGNPEKAPSLLQEMKAANVSPDAITYCLLMNSCTSRNDIDSLESFVREIEKDTQGPLSWSIYSNMASHFIAAGLFEKAEFALKKLEAVMDSHDRACYHHLISMFVSVGNLAEVIRVWKLLKNAFQKTTNRSFLIMFQACVKLDKMDMLKDCYDEWQFMHLSYDIRLPFIVMNAYMRKDMIKEFELVLDNVIERGYDNDCFTWETFIGYNLRRNEVDLALKSFKLAICCNKPHQWSPKKELVKEFLRYFEVAKDVERAETFCKILKDVDNVDLDAYESLLHA
ncbi:hypothetical protein KFK09_028282 [Dendrobium nobile]|uniref:Pentatricopeptide repeat-containing protein n=1 Tax=Dendrobium nobile TaxID=94219 RepID=A0A8T3A2Q3_DENNO|nr:hypothetical protein KFK09_028282 [Dendrobium nobile]